MGATLGILKGFFTAKADADDRHADDCDADDCDADDCDADDCDAVDCDANACVADGWWNAHFYAGWCWCCLVV